MRKIILLSVLAGLLLPACKKDNDPILNDPDKRLTETLDKYAADIQSAENGWIGYIWTGTGGGYSFYFDFTSANDVTMLSDIDTVSATVAKASTYRLKALQQPSLLFDTYNYLHKLSDPNPDVMGGTRNEGLTSDFEFAFLSSSADSIVCQGRLNNTPFKLYSATADEANQYKGGRIKELMKAKADFVNANPYVYLQFQDGVKLQLAFSGKSVLLSYISNGEVHTLSTDFAYSLRGLLLKDKLKYNGEAFEEILWDDTLKIFYVTSSGARTNVQPSSTPIIPFYLKFGFDKEYKLITVNPAVLIGLSADFTAVYNTAVAGLAAVGNNAGRHLNYFTIQFNGAQDMTLKAYYNNTAGTNFTATFLYKIAWTGNDVVDFEFVSRDGNANTAGPGIIALTNYLENNQFRIDWFANQAPAATNLLGGFAKVADPASFFFGTLN